MNVALPRSLNVDQFLAWAAAGGGEIRAHRWRGHHAAVAELGTLQHAAARTARPARGGQTAGRPLSMSVPMVPTVRISEHKAFVPDALVAPLPEPAPDSLEIPNPRHRRGGAVAVDGAHRRHHQAARLFRGAERPALPDRRSRGPQRHASQARHRHRAWKRASSAKAPCRSILPAYRSTSAVCSRRRDDYREVRSSRASCSTRAGSRVAAAPSPPPPGVMTTRRSPGRTTCVPLPCILRAALDGDHAGRAGACRRRGRAGDSRCGRRRPAARRARRCRSRSR